MKNLYLLVLFLKHAVTPIHVPSPITRENQTITQVE